MPREVRPPGVLAEHLDQQRGPKGGEKNTISYAGIKGCTAIHGIPFLDIFPSLTTSKASKDD